MNIGTIIQWASNTIPTGWLLCDGSAVSRTTYAELFSVIGTNFGTGDGSTTFNVPDLRGRIAVGKDTTQTEFDTLGETGGEKTHTLTVGEIPSHNHTQKIDGSYNSGGSGANKYAQNNTGSNATNGGLNTDYTGGGQAHNNLQPYIVTNYIIKATTPDTIKISELNEITALDDDDILPVVDTSADETKKIKKQNLVNEIYSTTEVKTNKVWKDGKPIYRTCFDLNSAILLNYTWQDVVSVSGMNISNITSYEVMNDSGIAWYSTIAKIVNNYLQLLFVGREGAEWYAKTIVLEYTKTTD